jgi:hypothetical protein
MQPKSVLLFRAQATCAPVRQLLRGASGYGCVPGGTTRGGPAAFAPLAVAVMLLLQEEMQPRGVDQRDARFPRRHAGTFGILPIVRAIDDAR